MQAGCMGLQAGCMGLRPSVEATHIGRGGSLGAARMSTRKQIMATSMRPQPRLCMCVLSRSPWRSCMCTTPTPIRQSGTHAQ